MTYGVILNGGRVRPLGSLTHREGLSTTIAIQTQNSEQDASSIDFANIVDVRVFKNYSIITQQEQYIFQSWDPEMVDPRDGRVELSVFENYDN
jgi:hypothetical protein